jgi:eukaryotic-like serine/threonine-protein kinase
VRILLRIVFVLFGLVLLVPGLFGLALSVVSKEDVAKIRAEQRQALDTALDQQKAPYDQRQKIYSAYDKGFDAAMVLGSAPVYGTLLIGALVCIGGAVFGLRGGGGSAPARSPRAPVRGKGKTAGKAQVEGEVDASDAMVKKDKKELKRALKQAEAIEKQNGAEAAGEFLLDLELRDEAAEVFQRGNLLKRVAEVRHDQNRFEEAVALYEQLEKWEAAAGVYTQMGAPEKAARCYMKVEKFSTAGEMFERANKFSEAGDCYVKIGFLRQAAQAYLKGNAEAKAADCMVQVFTEEGGGNAAKSEAQQKELKNLAKKAGEIFFKLERFEEAEQILIRAGALSGAAKVAFHVGAFDRAAEFFSQVGRGDLAAKALEKLGDKTAAARAMGEYLRDKGDDAAAVDQLEAAGEFEEAAGLYRKLDRHDEAGEAYWKAQNFAAAAEMFRSAGRMVRAGESYEQSRAFDAAAECFGQAGETGRQARMLEKAGDVYGAGKVFAEREELDEAIKLLQQVPPDDPNFGDACAWLGRLFGKKGMDTLCVKKLEQATNGAPVTRANVEAYYELAQAHERREGYEEAVEVFEKILSFDYHYRDVAERLESAKQNRSRMETSAPSAPSLPAVQTVGTASRRYEVMGELGRGGMGVVYRARDLVLERDVAFKVLPEQLRESPDALRNFLREAKAAAQLNHPNIVTVFDAGESEHGFYLAMELVEGTTLKQIVQKRGAIAPGGLAYILRQMADALAYAHSRKVVHRDIKTANTMWTTEKKVKIMDFGLAKLMEEVRNATTTISGTPFYMSPEQTLGKNVDHRTDIYSLGVTLFELATGELPFRRGNVPYHHVHTPPADPRSINDKVPESMAKVILRCLQKAPDDRYASAREVIEDLTRLSGSEEA